MFTHTLFDDIFASHPLLSPRVLVISDSEHKRLQQNQIQEQIAVLETRAASQRKQLEATELAITELKERISENKAELEPAAWPKYLRDRDQPQDGGAAKTRLAAPDLCKPLLLMLSLLSMTLKEQERKATDWSANT